MIRDFPEKHYPAQYSRAQEVGTEALAPCPSQTVTILGAQPFGKDEFGCQLHEGLTVHLSVKNSEG